MTDILPSVGAFYRNRGVRTKAELLRRHALLGYDWLDRAIAARGEKRSLRALVREHLTFLAQAGLVFQVTFRATLGLAIALTRYGKEGREFIAVAETKDDGDAYPDTVKPTDELVAVDGHIIVGPTKQNFSRLKAKIQEAARPLVLFFVVGEHRDEAFGEQEERRAMCREDAML